MSLFGAKLGADAFLEALVEQSEVREKCPPCGFVNVFPVFDQMLVYTCRGCGQATLL
jgi:hypothetical protein